MHCRELRVSRPDIWEKIQTLDLSNIEGRLETKLDWSPDQTREIAARYRGFLYLCAVYDDRPLAPYSAVDEFWHAHILDTRTYMHHCQQVFGHYLHHAPSYADADRKQSQQHFELTEALFEKEFGIPFFLVSDVDAKCSKQCSHQCKVGDNCDKDCGKPCNSGNPSPPSDN